MEWHNQHLHHRIQGGHNSTNNTMAMRHIHSCPILFNFMILLSLYCQFEFYMLHMNQFAATLPFFPRQLVNDYYLLLDFTLMATPWKKLKSLLLVNLLISSHFNISTGFICLSLQKIVCSTKQTGKEYETNNLPLWTYPNTWMYLNSHTRIPSTCFTYTVEEHFIPWSSAYKASVTITNSKMH